jgi:hypothetical protein
MASQWFCKVLGREVGPISFEELADLVRKGTLTEEDPVLRKGAHEWKKAREVIGLFRAAAREPVEEAPPPEPKPAPPTTPFKPKKPSRWRPRLPRVGRRAIITACCTLILIVLVGTAVRGLMSGRRERFPQTYKERHGDVEVDAATLSRPERTAPSAPGLEPRRPALIPGLQEVSPGFSPTLSSDLCTIVFSTPSKPGAGYDLYVARRESTSREFDEPQPIVLCNTRQAERFAALSPDGLELLFVRSESQPLLLRSTRANKVSSFGEPVPVPMTWLANLNHQLEWAHFVDDSRLGLCATDWRSGKRSFLFAVRPDQASGFGAGGQIPFRGGKSSQFFVVQSGLRAYYSQNKGISVTARATLAEPFRGGAMILDAQVTGPVKGPFWVAPQEDLIIYSSPGPGETTGRRLWMIGF